MTTHESPMSVRQEIHFSIFTLFSRRLILSTLIVMLAVAVMVRLGVWQLERLKQRRAFNERYLAQAGLPTLRLNALTLEQDLFNMEYRHVEISGEFDYEGEVAIRNQAYGNEWGVYLLTPLRVEGTDKVILVNRGWIPGDDYLTGDWSAYRQEGRAKVNGIIRRSQDKPDFGRRNDATPGPGEPPLKSWNFINVGAIAGQINGIVVPDVYIQMTDAPVKGKLPIPAQVEIEISEGPHLSYALQWFLFATILGIGYPIYVKRKGM